MKAIERLKQYIDIKGIKPAAFEKIVGLSNGYINKQFARNADLGESIFNKILENCPEINPMWLMFGTGEMVQTKNEKNVVKKIDHKNDHKNDHIPNVKKKYANELLQVSESRELYQNRTPAIVTIDSNNDDNIALVPIPLSAGYLEGYKDKDFISQLPSYRMPGLNNGIFRMFEVEGNSMYPTLPNKSYVVGQFVENWIRDIRDNQIYAVISNEVEGGLIKRCLNKIKKYNNLICKSDNRRNYPNQNINPASIKEVWEIKLHLNFHLPDPADIYDKLYDLEGEVSSLKHLLKDSNLLK